jgi:hypothetical protein
VSRHRYVDLTSEPPTDALNETWTVRVYDVRGGESEHRVFDLHVVHTTATDGPLVLPEYRYGGVGFRGPDEWRGEENTFFLTSEGHDRSDGHATRARWVRITGPVDGELAGVAILTHPQNFRAPEPMRIHPDEPFFNWAPSQHVDWSNESDDPFQARYRYLDADGALDPAEIDRLWLDFTQPPAPGALFVHRSHPLVAALSGGLRIRRVRRVCRETLAAKSLAGKNEGRNESPFPFYGSQYDGARENDEDSVRRAASLINREGFGPPGSCAVLRDPGELGRGQLRALPYGNFYQPRLVAATS